MLSSANPFSRVCYGVNIKTPFLMEKWGFVLSHDVTRNWRTVDKKIPLVIVALLFVFLLPVSAEFIREINKALTAGLETAIFVMDKWDERSP